MAYRVNLSQRAERDLDLLYEAIGAGRTAATRNWYQGLKRAVYSLEENPLRCATTPEDKRFRHLLFGKRPNVYRVIYRVVLKTVQILHIRHGAMDEFSPEELARNQ
ncbi:MAG: type II toxin-antitoxin system RelE/ParE family toxin [Bryobacteraceae bacterium]